MDLQLNNATTILEQEINWIKSVQSDFLASESSQSDCVVESELLEGHLGITKELLAYQTPQRRHQIGRDDGGSGLLMVSTRLKSLDS